MKKLISLFAGIMAFVMMASIAEAKPKKRYKARVPAAVVVHVDISSQRMSVQVNGSNYAYWTVSTGTKGFGTPTGSYSVKRMTRMHYSRKYNNTPMPHSIFFHGGFAIHATNQLRALGRPASHGCVRLSPGNAARLYALVQRYGASRTRVTLTY